MIQKILKCGKYLTETSYKDLFIDSSMIKNVKGYDMLGINHYDRGRLGSKVHLIATGEGIPLAMKLTGVTYMI